MCLLLEFCRGATNRMRDHRRYCPSYNWLQDCLLGLLFIRNDVYGVILSNGTFFTNLGQGGVGKSTTLKHIALEWAGDKQQHLERFDYVYHIALKHVKAGQTIPELIVKQHKLKALGVSVHEIQAILEGSTQQHVSDTVHYYTLRSPS